MTIPAEQVAQEELLLEYLRHIETSRHGWCGIRIALSRLSPFNRRQSHLQLARNGFRRLASQRRGQVFTLANEDLLFFYAAEEQDAVNREACQLRTLFAEDSLMGDVENAASFSRIYDLGAEFRDVVQLARASSRRGGDDPAMPPDGDATNTPGVNADNHGATTKDRLKRRQQLTRPIPVHMLPKLDAVLQRADISSFILRRPVCRLLADTPPQQIFTDLAISLRALGEAIVPTFDLEADACTARFLTETLDRRMLTMLLRHEAQAERGVIAIPLSLATLLSAAFRHFDDQISMMRRGSIVLKLGLADIFLDLDAARFVFRLARHRGYRILLEGVTAHSLPLLSLDGLGIDFVRLTCTPSLLHDPAAAERLAGAGRRLAPAQIILGAVDAAPAVALGAAGGLQLFQGHHLDHALREAKARQRLGAALGSSVALGGGDRAQPPGF